MCINKLKVSLNIDKHKWSIWGCSQNINLPWKNIFFHFYVYTYVNLSNFKTLSQSSVHDLDENIFLLLHFVMRSFGGTFRLSQCIVKMFFFRLKRSLSLVTEQKKKKEKLAKISHFLCKIAISIYALFWRKYFLPLHFVMK